MCTFNRHFSFRNIIHIDILTQLKYIFNELLLWELLAILSQPSVRLFAFSIRMLDFKMLGIRKPFGSSPDVTNRPNHRRHELNCVQPNVCLFFGFRFVYSHTQQSKGYQFREDTKYLCVICIANMKSTENKMSKHKSISISMVRTKSTNEGEKIPWILFTFQSKDQSHNWFCNRKCSVQKMWKEKIGEFRLLNLLLNDSVAI